MTATEAETETETETETDTETVAVAVAVAETETETDAGAEGPDGARGPYPSFRTSPKSTPPSRSATCSAGASVAASR